MAKLALFDVFVEWSWAERIGLGGFLKDLVPGSNPEKSGVLALPTRKINHEDYSFLQVTVFHPKLKSQTTLHIPKSQVIGILAMETADDLRKLKLGFMD